MHFRLFCAFPVALSLSILSGCGGGNNASSDGAVPPIDRTQVIFSPATGEFPIPNDILFSAEPLSDGTMNANGCDEDDPAEDFEACLAEAAANPVLAGIDVLDGNSVLAPIEITFDDSLDATQSLDANAFAQLGGAVVPNPNQNVFLLPLTYPGGDSLLQAEGEIPTFFDAVAFQQAIAAGDVAALGALAANRVRATVLSLDGGQDNVIRIQPLEPLLPQTKYLVILTNLSDAAGNPVFQSDAYTFLKDPDSNLESFGDSAASLNALRSAIQGWETLATGYFNFMQSVFDAAQIESVAPTLDDVTLTFTFTTTDPTKVMTAVAAPETFFEASNRISIRQTAISNLVSGVFSLQGTTIPNLDEPDATINTTLIGLLTLPTISSAPNPLFNDDIANAIASGAEYAAIAEDASAAYLMQLAAAEAAISVNDNDGVSLQAEATGTVAAIAAGVSAPVEALFPVAAPRPSSFFRVDPAASIFAGLSAPANIFQGQITLPQFQTSPSVDVSAILSARWEANGTIGAVIDGSQGNPAGTTPPSDIVTYRYPFPTVQGSETIPVIVTMPDETTLGAFGITKPANGWPVIIFNHGIGSDRSSSLPLANALAFACIDASNPEAPVPSGAPCFATVAIDQPLHGVAAQGSTVPGLISSTDPNNSITPNLPNTPSAELTERHFDFTADASVNPVPMDYDAGFGASGSLFVNLGNFATGTDNLRQMVIDLLNVNASIDTMDVNADSTADDLDPNNVFFIGMSLGGINGIPFVATNNNLAVQASSFSTLPRIKAATGLNTGGGVPRLLTNSNTFAAQILQGLFAASESLAQGQSALELYLSVYQGVIDTIDPINYAASLSDANSDTGIYLTEIIGDGTPNNLPDQVIPNAADNFWGPQFGPLQTTVPETGFVIDGFPAPFAGTEPLINEFAAVPTGEAVDDGDAPVTVTRFEEGTHGTPISADNITVFSTIVSQIVGLFAPEVE